MGRYSRAVYGTGKYGLDLWAEKSVEPMIASIEVDNVFSHSSSFTNDWGDPVYDRVQVSWLLPQGVDFFLLLRSNLGYPTGPNDPFAATLMAGPKTTDVRTNLVANPNFERDLSGWAVNRGTGALTSSDFNDGSSALQMTCSQDGSMYAYEAAQGTSAHATSPGQVMTAGYSIKVPSTATSGVSHFLSYYDSSGTYTGNSAVQSSAVTPGGWSRVVASWTVPDNVAFVRLVVGSSARVAGDVVLLDSVTLEQADVATSGTPFSGDSPSWHDSDGCLYEYSWEGTPGASNSVETETPGINAEATPVTSLGSDPLDRQRMAYLDRNVEPGREYFYSAWTYVASADEWIQAGRAMVTTSSDHGLVEGFHAALPAYIWNVHGGPGDGVDVLPDADPENHMGRFLQSFAWQLDKTLTKVDLMRQVWDPQRTPAVVLDEAISMYGLPNEPALGARASRALLANAAEITGERGSLDATGLLVESLTGYAAKLQVGTNLIASPTESSFESLVVAGDGTQRVIGGTGRWCFSNAALTRVSGDPAPAPGGGVVQIARVPNSDDDFGRTSDRWGLRLDSVDPAKDLSMTLGERIRVTKVAPLGAGLSQVTTAWVHGLEVGDKVSVTLDGGATSGEVTVLAVLGDFNVRVDSSKAANLPDSLATPADGYLFGGMIPVYQGVPVDGGVAYSMVGMFQTASAQNFTLTMTYYDRFGNKLGDITASPTKPVPPPPSWVTSDNQVYASGSSPEGAVSATATITMTSTRAQQYLCADSLMLKPGGTPFDANQSYDTGTPYDGSVDYTYEDARLLTITLDPTSTPSNGPVPAGISGDHAAVILSRLTSVLAEYLPAGSAFTVRGLDIEAPVYILDTGQLD